MAAASLIAHFRAPVCFAFAYGSAAFRQRANPAAASLLDIVLVVDKPREWHAANLDQHPDHYAPLMRLVDAPIVAAVQECGGAGMFYNPFVRLPDGQLVKYGIVSRATIIDDLRSWRTLYLAGRMQKPIHILRGDDGVIALNNHNRHAALSLALLLLGPRFALSELLAQIVSLSYIGDFRMLVGGENPDKVRNIVEGQIEELSGIYLPLLGLSTFQGSVASVGASLASFEQEISAEYAQRRFHALPRSFRYAVETVASSKGLTMDGLLAPESSAHLNSTLHEAIKQTVQWPAIVQAAKGVITAGPVRSVAYAAAKLTKRFKR